MVQVQVFLKGGVGRGGQALLLFYFLKVYNLHLKITLPFSKLHYAFEEKNFSATIILGKKVILSCLKLSVKISHKLR